MLGANRLAVLLLFRSGDADADERIGDVAVHNGG